MSNITRDPVVKLVQESRIRAAFMVATLFTCGLGLIPWLIWEITKRKN